VIIYGNTEGVRVVWYGGKSFQASQSTTTKSKINGTNKDEPMVIDLDDDEPSAKDILAEEAEFEEEEEEVDTAQPYRNILRFLDIPLGTTALHLAIPSSSKTIMALPLLIHAESRIRLLRLILSPSCSVRKAVLRVTKNFPAFVSLPREGLTLEAELVVVVEPRRAPVAEGR
jgi:hypothetical protein